MEVPIITTAEIRVPEEKMKQQLRHQGICLIEPSVEKCEPEIGILIGADVLWSITSSEIKRINMSCVAIETAFGWCLSGTFRNEESLTCGFMNVTSQLTVDLDKSVKSFWELESIGMNETNDSSSETEKALQIFDSSIILKEKCYEISLPLKEENIKLNENFYVDDFIYSVDSDEEARQVYHEAKLILSGASMNLTKWKTNSNALKEEVETATSKEVNLGFPDSSSKVLGLKYNSSKDLFTFSPETIVEASHSNEPTKRTVLQISSKLFDPIGFLSPYSIQAKILFQKLWIDGMDWDKNIPENMKTMWKNWCQNLQDLADFEVSRRVAPLKKLTLPRLELLAAVIAARLLCVVQPHFPSAKIYLWTDSLIVLHWIKSSKRWKQFVNNRVQEIKQKTSPANWYHCPGNQNPADKITRGCSVKQLSQDNSWKFGPPWLSDFKSSWPVQENSSICCDSEQSCSMCCESDNYDNSESDIVPVFNCAVNKPILNIEDFSTLRRLLRVTSFVFRFIYNARNSNRRSGPITSSETSKALIYFIKMSQENSFSSEIYNIKLNKSVNKNSKLCNFNVMIDDDNILRIKSRLTNSSLDVYEKHPIILSNDYFASLIVYDCHEQVLHNGVNETLIQVRMASKHIAPLPNDRIEKSQPFETTGVDFAGPLYLKEGSKFLGGWSRLNWFEEVTTYMVYVSDPHQFLLEIEILGQVFGEDEIGEMILHFFVPLVKRITIFSFGGTF
ncbi:uncharacterized protein TNCT_186921 [Trichonephila clavata]|uniref:Peptidase aspartic putative domain-containing protein n=1 Tax=Trichonephila clavata TaxID=2740835 RepID=A0A8X6K9D9_TRICU|nr:uncharacterized protein TNCT_186921 [Trichonephila clavata]